MVQTQSQLIPGSVLSKDGNTPVCLPRATPVWPEACSATWSGLRNGAAPGWNRTFSVPTSFLPPCLRLVDHRGFCYCRNEVTVTPSFAFIETTGLDGPGVPCHPRLFLITSIAYLSNLKVTVKAKKTYLYRHQKEWDRSMYRENNFQNILLYKCACEYSLFLKDTQKTGHSSCPWGYIHIFFTTGICILFYNLL